jgi:dephospho-CoA kinase
LILGVTGGVGCGKSVFCAAFSKWGVEVVDADRIAQEIIHENSSVRRSLKRAFGTEIFDGSGRLKREELARIVFHHRPSLERLNRIVWPALLSRLKSIIKKSRAVPETSLVVDMAVLFESEAAYLFDKVIVVSASPEKRSQWLRKSRGWSEKQISDRMASQMDLQEKIERADFVVENDGSPESLEHKAEEVYCRWLEKCE